MRIITFQTDAIAEIADTFKKLWYADGSCLPLVFKAPTGSGKTFMVTSAINGLGTTTPFDDDVAWFWITFSEELALQSKTKFEEYFFPNAGRRLLTAADFAEGKLRRNDVLFINWQKLVARDAVNRVLRRPTGNEPQKESGFYFEDVISATRAEGRKIALVIDESHKNVTEAAWRDVIGIINPKVMIEVSATPEHMPSISDIKHNKAGYVEVEREDVVKEGLIKEAVVSQTEDELKGATEEDTDHKMLELAMERREDLAAKWQALGSKVKPLVLIQLPDDDNSLKAQKKEDVVIAYLKRQGVTEEKIAFWFDKKKSKCVKERTIEENDAPEEFLLFKYAAGTGWDCPRAQVLVMFREIKSPTFKVQTLGRIIRNPEPDMDLSRSPDLRLGYLYTNYSRNMVESDGKGKDDNSILTRHAYLIDRLLQQIQEGDDYYVVDANMTTEFVSRADYGDLGKSSAFQASFVASLDKSFDLTKNDLMAARTKKVEAKGIDTSPSLTTGMIAGAKWRSDAPEGSDGGGVDVQQEVSANEAEKLFTRACSDILLEQTETEAKVSNIVRSTPVLRSSLRLWLKSALPDIAADTAIYKIFLKDLAKGASSVFRPILTAALKDYAPVRKEFVKARRKREEERPPEKFTLRRTYDYPEQYEVFEGNAALSAVQPFMLPKDYNGRKNEVDFIAYLEQQADNIDWWFKNGNEGKDYFGLKYRNSQTDEIALFYPDWIVKFKDGRIGIFDTKGGMTAQNPEGREMGLAAKIAAMNLAVGTTRFVGGLVVKENGVWHYHEGKDYAYQPGHLDNGWKPMSVLMCVE